MRGGYIAVVLIFCALVSKSQCLSDFKKILPEKSPAAFDAYGQSVAILGDYAVVGSPRNDSLGYNAGLVYVYKKIVGQWKRHAILSPPDPSSWGGFGHSVDITDEYIVVGAADEVSHSIRGAVYVFKKPIGDWISTAQPVATLRVDGAKTLGWSVRMTDDGAAIAAGDFATTPTPTGSDAPGAVYVFRKPAGEWNDFSSFIKLTPEADKRHFYFGWTVDFDDKYLFVGTQFYGDHFGAIYVYQSDDAWASVEKKVVLRTSLAPGYSSHIGEFMTASHDRVVALGNVYPEGTQLFVFEKGIGWGSQETESYRVPLESQSGVGSFPMGISQTDDKIFAAIQPAFSSEKYFVLEKQGGSFQVTPTMYSMSSHAQNRGAFGTAVDSDGENVIIGNPYDHVLKDAAGSVVIIPKGTGSFDPVNIQRLVDRPINTVDHLFGSAILKKEDHLFIGSVRDSHNAALGSVSIYKKMGTDWAFQTKISPPHELTPDARFGTSIAASDALLVVSTTYYNHEGAVFVYRKKTSWHDLELLQIIRPFTQDGKKYQIGDQIAINGDVLVISSHQETTFTTSMLVYKLQGNQFLLDQTFSLGRSRAALLKEIDLSFYGNTLAVGCITSNSGGNVLLGNVFLFEPDATGKLDTVATVQAPIDASNAFGYQVKLTEDHLFVSDAGHNSNGVVGAGAILVYPKPMRGWSSTPMIYNYSGSVTAAMPQEWDFFGSDFDVEGNILIVGAQQSEILYNPLRESTNPGVAYVIQGLDFNWKSTRQLFRYQGEFRNHRDTFGNAVTMDRDEFLVGAFNENQPDAEKSGAVYTITTPPLVKLERPVCVNSGPRQLNGYPFDGIWSGPGITNAQMGYFDPALAGIGNHRLIYRTPNCAYEGQLEIEVMPTPQANWINTEQHFFCAQGNKEILLEITPVPDAIYRWFVKPIDANNFSPVNAQGPSIKVLIPGTYYLEIDNGACIVRSTDQIITIEKLSIELTELPVVCVDEATPLQLNAKPAGGIWKGIGVTPSGSLEISSVPNGLHEFIYTITSDAGCIFTDTLQLRVDLLPKPVLSGVGDFCLEGDAVLQVVNQTSGWFRYFKVSPQSSELIKEGQDLYSVPIETEGIYAVEISDEYCSARSEPYDVRPLAFRMNITPQQNEIRDICYLETYPMEIVDFKQEYSYKWLYKKEWDGTTLEIDQAERRKEISNAGYYQVEAQYGNCQLTSEWKYFQFTKADSVYAPNVFTPNGDDKNATFSILLPDDAVAQNKTLEIFNRYGKKVYESHDVMQWDGKEFSSGVYFWMMTYSNCAGRPYQYKGWVNLIR